MTSYDRLFHVVDLAFEHMKRSGPRNLHDLVAQLWVIEEHSELQSGDWTRLENLLIEDDPNGRFYLRVGRQLREWDADDDHEWARGTARLSAERRDFILQQMALPGDIGSRLQELHPPASLESQPIVIAREHEVWYTPEVRDASTFYWDAYAKHLQDVQDWPPESIESLNEAANMIMANLSDPTRPEVYQTKGLVVGYVQSGKTANFTAVIAKAADAGYRLIIVLAGTLNILREQTQRRIDKELIGKELLRHSGFQNEYDNDSAWDEFIEHGSLPSEKGSFDWHRLTGLKDEYQRLRAGIHALEFTKHFRDRRLNDPANLRHVPARLIVMKKNPAVLRRLNEDLRSISTALEEVPAIIIDDESDQASLNTKRPSKREEQSRTSTNEQIVELLKTLRRAQYIGYTATPFANVFVNPSDSEDLFPKDYIVSLGRPSGYMGVSDFFDFDEEFRELEGDDKPKGFHSNENAFVRDVLDEDENPDNLPRAIESFILSGAIKLFRAERGVPVSTKHHTMLVHRSTRQRDHEDDKRLVEQLWESLRIGTSSFYTSLERLWQTDYKPVSQARQTGEVNPESFADLRGYIDRCVSKIQGSDNPVRIVNGETRYVEQLPNFDRESVWSILVGGTKLSRGYTVEGLTVSYFRRRIRTADTLMQVGRWFGFRRGYRDLVRLFIGRQEPDGRNRTMDLYAAFQSICRDEERFRIELRRYAALPGEANRIQPAQIPPLVPSHLLAPTAKNKMYNAIVRHQNFGGEWIEPVRLPHVRADRQRNAESARKLLSSTFRGPAEMSVKLGEEQSRFEAYFAVTSPTQVIQFLSSYRWLDGVVAFQREQEFLKGSGEMDPEIDRWVVLLPQQARGSKGFWRVDGQKLDVFERTRTTTSGSFKVISESRHRSVAFALAGIQHWDEASAAVRELAAPRTAVMVIYPVVERGTLEDNGEVPDSRINVGFALQFPKNSIDAPITFGVRDKNQPDEVIVDQDLS